MDRCICCGRELDYEGTLICWECEKSGGTDLPRGRTQRTPSTIPNREGDKVWPVSICKMVSRPD